MWQVLLWFCGRWEFIKRSILCRSACALCLSVFYASSLQLPMSLHSHEVSTAKDGAEACCMSSRAFLLIPVRVLVASASQICSAFQMMQIGLSHHGAFPQSQATDAPQRTVSTTFAMQMGTLWLDLLLWGLRFRGCHLHCTSRVWVVKAWLRQSMSLWQIRGPHTLSEMSGPQELVLSRASLTSPFRNTGQSKEQGYDSRK